MIDRDLAPESIVGALEEETPDRRPLMRRLRLEAPAIALVGALERAHLPLARQLLCDLLGFRPVRSAVPVLTVLWTTPRWAYAPRPLTRSARSSVTAGRPAGIAV